MLLQLFYTFYNVIVPIFLVTIFGFLADRRFRIDTRSLSQITVYFASPALAYNSLSHSTLEAEELGQLALFTFIMAAIVAAFSWQLARFLKLNQKLVGAFALSSTLTNNGNFGLPFVAFAFGDTGLSAAIVIFACGAIISNTLGIFLASTGSASIKASLINILKVPLPYAVILGIATNFASFSLPVPIEQGISLMGDSAIPMMLIVLGARLSRTKIQKQFNLVLLASTIKVMIVPFLGFLIAKQLTLSTIATNVAIIQISMPTAVISIILAEEFGSDADFVSAVVLVSTLASFVSLSILLNFLT